MTFDNGKEFAEHRKLTRWLGLEVYFADPYASWQRGANENMNGLLRQFFPKRHSTSRTGPANRPMASSSVNLRPSRISRQVRHPLRNAAFLGAGSCAFCLQTASPFVKNRGAAPGRGRKHEPDGILTSDWVVCVDILLPCETLIYRFFCTSLDQQVAKTSPFARPPNRSTAVKEPP